MAKILTTSRTHSGSGRRRRAAPWLLAIAAVAALAVLVTGCSGSSASGTTSASGAANTDTAAPAGSAGGSAPSAAAGQVTLVTHDSFVVDEQMLADFEASSGLQVTVLAQGDAGAMVNQLLLTAGNPLGDAVFGIDNTFASKALDAGILAPYTAPAAAGGADRFGLGDDRLTAVDYGDVCVNVDHTYFAGKGLAEPVTFEDLAKPEYKDLLVVESPATSSPGLAFLLGTIAHFGEDGWQAYWTQLKDNGVKVTSGWTDAYTVDFSGSSGKGARPLVVSYASSPPAEITDAAAGSTSGSPSSGSTDAATGAPTGALLDTCFRQVEYAGVLAGAKNPAGAQQVVDFLLSPQFQAAVPEAMYVYPVDPDAPLPATWQQYAPVASAPAELDPAIIAANRDSLDLGLVGPVGRLRPGHGGDDRDRRSARASAADRRRPRTDERQCPLAVPGHGKDGRLGVDRGDPGDDVRALLLLPRRIAHRARAAPRRHPRPGGNAGSAGQTQGAADSDVHPVAGGRLRGAGRRARSAGCVCAVLQAFPGPGRDAGAGHRAVRAAHYRCRAGLPDAVRHRRPVGRVRLGRNHRRHPLRPRLSQLCGGGAHCGRQLGAPGHPARGGRPQPGRRPRPGAADHHPALPAAGDRGRLRDGVPVLRHQFRDHADPGRFPVRDPGDRGLPADRADR